MVEDRPNTTSWCSIIFANRFAAMPCAASDAADVAWVTRGPMGEYCLAVSAQRVIQKAFEMARERKEMGNQAEDFPGKL